MQKKVVVIGGGPGGYVAAIRAAQLGAEVHLVEKNKIGGTCLNVGCIPTKVLLHSTELLDEIKQGKELGIRADNINLDWEVLLKRKEKIVNRLTGGVAGLLKAYGVSIHMGTAVIKDRYTVQVEGSKQEQVKADFIIVASGSVPVRLRFPGADLPGVIDSTAALSLDSVPKSMIIIGGGVIGVEFASVYNSLGCKVTIVEMLSDILPTLDKEITAAVREELEKKGVRLLNDTRVTEVSKKDTELTINMDYKGRVKYLKAEKVLVAVGRMPYTDLLGLDTIGVTLERGKIDINDSYQTNVDNIYAIGDCNGRLMLAHVASAQGVFAVEHALGHNPIYCQETVPSCIYTNPEVACVGLSEEEAKKKGIPYKVGRFALSGNGKALICNEGKGFIKIIVGKKYDEILGVHMVGHRATDIIAEAALAIRLEATVDELVTTIHAHPTVTEAMLEAALDVNNMAIHWPPK